MFDNCTMNEWMNDKYLKVKKTLQKKIYQGNATLEYTMVFINSKDTDTLRILRAVWYIYIS